MRGGAVIIRGDVRAAHRISTTSGGEDGDCRGGGSHEQADLERAWARVRGDRRGVVSGVGA